MNHFSVKEFAQLFVRLRNGIETAVGLGVPPESAKKASAKPSPINARSAKRILYPSLRFMVFLLYFIFILVFFF